MRYYESPRESIDIFREEYEFLSNFYPTKVFFEGIVYCNKDGRASVSWMLQPDGRYFSDEDGFGAEDCTEICLYSHLDEEGNFTEPFQYGEYRKSPTGG